MHLSPDLQHTITQIAASQGISPEQFIIQALIEKIDRLKQLASTSQTGLRQKDGLLVFDTESLDHTNFNTLIAQSREDQDWE